MNAICDRCLHILGQIFRFRAVSKAVKIKIYKPIVQPFVLYGRETWRVTEMSMKGHEYMREENVKEDVWTSGRTRNVGNKN
jgi:hypothetical protein